MLYFDGYDVLVRFRPPTRNASSTTSPAGPVIPSGRVLIGQLGSDEFLIAGFDAAVDFKPPMGSENTKADYLRVEEGTYENGAWKTTYLRNGNFNIGGVALSSQGAMLKAKLMKY